MPLAGDYGRHYHANSRGVIVRTDTGRPLKVSLTPNRVRKVSLSVGGRAKTGYVAVLVYEAFFGTPPKGYIVGHLDDDPGNNSPFNLAAKTPAEWREHRRISREWLARGGPSGHGLIPAKLTDYTRSHGLSKVSPTCRAGHWLSLTGLPWGRGNRVCSVCSGLARLAPLCEAYSAYSPHWGVSRAPAI